MQNKAEQYKDAKATSYNDIPAGGYVVEIADVTDMPNKEYLLLELDIHVGEYANYYADLFSRAGFWGLVRYLSYKDKSMGWFKADMELIEKENEGFTWNWDEKALVGLKVGVILGAEEYNSNSGEVKTSLKVKKFVPVEDIYSGKFKVPDLKKLKGTEPVKGVTNNSASAQKQTEFKEIEDPDKIPF